MSPKKPPEHPYPVPPAGVTTLEQLAAVVEAYMEFDEFVFDVETMGADRLNPLTNEVFWISLAGPGRADAIPCGHPVGERIHFHDDTHRINPNTRKHEEHRINPDSGRLKWFPIPEPFTDPPRQVWRSEVFAWLKPLLLSERRKVGHNVKFDLRSVAKYLGGVVPPPPYGDTLVAAKLVNENHLGHRPYALDSCVQRAFRFRYEKIGKAVETHPYSAAHLYSYYDAKWNWLLWQVLKKQLRREGVEHIFELEMELLPVLIDAEETGIPIDLSVFEQLGVDFQLRMAELERDINKVAGWEVNLNANAQVGKLVYDVLGHKCRVFTGTEQRSVAREALEAFPRDKTVIRILEHAEYSKLYGTFVVKLPKLATEDSRLHPSFDQAGTVTGRFSSKEPNIQQIPSRSELGRKLREGFVASKGNVLLVADLSQIELRVLAHFTQDRHLLKAYREGLDLHDITAEAVFGPDFTPLQRSLAKNGNFSVVFGAGPATLVRKYGFPNERVASSVLDGFYQKYRAVRPWKEHVLQGARLKRKMPYVETVLGRKRRLPDLYSPENSIRYGAERQAISSIIQGSAADLFKVIMIDFDRSLEEQDWEGHILMLVHDELVVEVPEEVAEEGLVLLRESMEGVENPFTGKPLLSVPVVADAKIVDRWVDAK